MKHDPSRSRFNSTHRARARSRAMAGSTYGTPDHAQLWARTDSLNLWNVRGRRRIDHRAAPDDGLLVPFPFSQVTRSAKWPSTAVVADTDRKSTRLTSSPSYAHLMTCYAL